MNVRETSKSREESEVLAELRDAGIAAALVANLVDVATTEGEPIDLALINTSSMTDATVKASLDEFAERQTPTMLLAPESGLRFLDPSLEFGDLLVTPARRGEAVFRARRLIVSRPDEQDSAIHSGDLLINPANYEVSVAGRMVNLRFKEYELLLLMATNPGRVYSREQLLERVWGYDYLGGARTVDVHIRRLRSKIEDSGHQFIETVWNVGYRFKEPSG